MSISAHRPGRQALKHTAEVSYYIHPEFQHQGIATRLLQHAIDICPELKIKNLFAILLENNQYSIELLEKFGFKRWGYLPGVAIFGDVELGQFYYGLKT